MQNKSIASSNSFNLWRVVFTFVIMLFHLTDQYYSFYDKYPSLHYHWYVAVEFFFILSGFLMADHAMKHEGESALIYTKGRIKRLYPEYILVFVIMVIMISKSTGTSIPGLLMLNWEEIFMLQSIGTGKFPYINNPAWYVSSLFIAGHFIYYLLQRHRKLFLEFIGPILILGLFHLFYQDYEALNSFFSTSKYGVSTGVLRALLGLTIGIYVYYLSKMIVKDRSRVSQWIWAIAEVMAFLFVIIFSITHENLMYDFGFLFITAFGVLASSQNSLFKKVVESKVILVLCKISYGMFLSHYITLAIVDRIWQAPEWNWGVVPVFIVITVILAVIINWCGNMILKAITKKK